MVVSDTMRVGSSIDRPRISKILEFRLMDNSFRFDLPMPPNLPSHADSLNYFDLKNIQGQLIAFQFYHSPNNQSELKLWTFNEETRDWKTWMTISPMGYELGSMRICDFMEPLCMNLDGELLMVFSSIASQGLTKLVLFDTKTSTRSMLGDFFAIDSRFPKGTRGYLGQMTYIESLVSPHLFEPTGKSQAN
jgi:hypothetical protein